jgi:general secretion pathway protein D
MINKQIFKGVNCSRPNRFAGLFILIFILLIQVGCLSNPLRTKPRPLSTIDSSEIEDAAVDDQPDHAITADDVNAETKQVIEIQAGNDHYLGTEREHHAKNISVNEKGISLNFKNMELQAFIQAVLGDALKQNYVIDPMLTGSVTIQTVRPLPEDDLIGVLQEVLSLNGATMMLNDGRYRIVPLNKASQLPLVSRVKQLHNQGYGLQIVPLHFIGATEMAQIIKPSMQNQGIVYTDKRRNLLILSGSEALLTSVIDLVTIFDVDWLAGKSISLFPLRYVEPESLVKELELALDGQGGELFDGMVRLIPIERVNSVLVVSTTTKYMHELSIWIKRLDISNDKAEKRLYVYHLQNTKAVDIANVLTNIFDTEHDQNDSKKTTATVLPTDQPVTLTTISETEKTSNSEKYFANQLAADKGLTLVGQASIRIIADEISNTLVIMATSHDYEMVESAIRKLDILPKQVLIEATIAEVRLVGDLSYGVEWFFKNNGVGSNKTGIGKLSLGADGIAAKTPGFSYSIVDSLGDIRVVLNALESETSVEVLSSPSIMVLDNHSASINVGDEIPVPTRQSSSNIDPDAPTVNEIEYRNTGISLSVSPRVNAGGLVTLEVKQEVSDAIITTTSGIDAPTIQQRAIESTVAIQSGQSVILGGLILDNRADNESGIPILGKIPGLGKLFSQTSNSDRRTELLVILTPHVVANSTQAQAITDEYRKKLVQPIQQQN